MIWSHIIIHHSLTKDSGTVSWGAIRRYHVQTLGWQDIGYNFGVEDVDGHFEVLMGRPLWMNGAHCRDMQMNSHGIGVCFVGNFDLNAPGTKRLEAADPLMRWLMDTYHIPVENILGYREVGRLAGFEWTAGEFKSCPGKLWDMDAFRARYAEA